MIHNNDTQLQQKKNLNFKFGRKSHEKMEAYKREIGHIKWDASDHYLSIIEKAWDIIEVRWH